MPKGSEGKSKHPLQATTVKTDLTTKRQNGDGIITLEIHHSTLL